MIMIEEKWKRGGRAGRGTVNYVNTQLTFSKVNLFVRIQKD